MEWISNEMPPQSGAYLICVMMPVVGGQNCFVDLAYFDKETGYWLKFDPFVDRVKPSDPVVKIEDKITAWTNKYSVFVE